MFTLTLSDTITAGTSITLGSISEYKPGISTAISVWQNSTQNRRYMASIGTDGKIILKSSTDMPASSYYIYIQAAYICA